MQMVSDRRAAGGPQGGCDDDIDTLASNSDFVLPFLKQLLNEYQRGNWPKKATALTVNMGTVGCSMHRRGHLRDRHDRFWYHRCAEGRKGS